MGVRVLRARARECIAEVVLRWLGVMHTSYFPPTGQLLWLARFSSRFP